MVRSPERPMGSESHESVPGKRTNASDLYRVRSTQPRENRWKKMQRCTLATAGRADYKQVVTACSRNCERTLEIGEAAQMRIVAATLAALARVGLRCFGGTVRVDFAYFAKGVRNRTKRCDSGDTNTGHHASFDFILGCHDRVANAVPAGLVQRGQHPANARDLASEMHFAKEDDVARKTVCLMRGIKNAGGDGEVKPVPRLGNVCGRETHKNARRWIHEPAIADPNPDSLTRFADLTRRQSDDIHAGDPHATVNFNPNKMAVIADGRI